MMIHPKLMVEPSHWLETGIQVERLNGLSLFKFTNALQDRSDELLEQSKSGNLTPEEQAELDGISELSQIFTYANSVLAAESRWSLNPSENSSPDVLATHANIATRQSS
jgi:hypothetical protein